MESTFSPPLSRALDSPVPFIATCPSFSPSPAPFLLIVIGDVSYQASVQWGDSRVFPSVPIFARREPHVRPFRLPLLLFYSHTYPQHEPLLFPYPSACVSLLTPILPRRRE